MKQYELTDYDISSAKIKNCVIKNFRKNLLDRIKHCGPGKKLKTYKLFKSTIAFESYLDIIKNPTQRKIYSKFRLSSHELEIEQGRYGDKSIPADQRYCKLCKTSKVEDEFHFVIECPVYKKERLNLLEYIEEHFKTVAELQAFDKFIWLMSQEDPLCILKVAKFLQKANDMRQKEIQLRLLNK